MSGALPTDHQRARVLVVDDEELNLDLLNRSLRRTYDVVAASGPTEALEMLQRMGPDEVAMILSDYRMPDMNGAEFLAESAKTHPDARRVIITGYADTDNLIQSVNAGRIHYVVTKPWKHHELQRVLEQLMHGYLLERENRRLVEELRGANDELRATERVLTRSVDEQERDLTSTTRELDRVGRELEVLAYKDALTGLYNHRAFQERLTEELARARRYGQSLALVYADIDGFAEVNRSLGYQLGDEILRRVSDVICATESDSRVRASDIVARFAGEEFMVLLPETNKQGGLTKAERLRDAMGTTIFPGGEPVSVCFGVGTFPEDASDADELIRCTSAALQAAKRNGRNQVHLYSAEGLAPATDSAVVELPTFSDIERFPTYYSQLDELISMLRRDRSASSLFVDLSRLRRIELDFGISQHSDIFVMAGMILDDMRGEYLREADLVCRTQDDDGYLCVLSPARTDGVDVPLEQIAHRVEERLNQALAPEVHDLLREHPRVSVGYARVLNNSMLRPERILARLVSESKNSAALERERRAQKDKNLLQEVILSERLTPVYQPIVHLQTGEIFGFEALTRGPRNTALESPTTLFAVADDVDLTFELDRACFRSCLRGAVGLEPVHRLFVNLLPLSFYDASFIETEVSHLLEAAALTPANVVFEITERLAIENFNTFRRALARYTSMGFGVAIDDVGTRHSNLETVMALRPNLIKVSDVLCRGVARSTVKREMIQSLCRIAEAIDAVVVAEGIETPDDLVVLHDLGVRYGQGYFLARPGPPFPRLRAAVRRAITTMVTAVRDPIAVPPADRDDDYDDYDEDGDRRESTGPGEGVREAVLLMAQGSGRFHVEPDGNGVRRTDEDYTDEDATPLVHDSGSWEPLSARDLGRDESSPEMPLIDSLRARNGNDDAGGERSASEHGFTEESTDVGRQP